VRRLQGAVRCYAWGSRTAIAELCGRPVPTAHPEAEIWFGAHPADPARLVGDGRTLLELIAADPQAELDGVATDFGGRLPFLLKVLAADEPLSLQAHPSAEQARSGFDRENKAKVPLNSSIRNYSDDNHKPELVVALERFEALAGFRDPHQTVALLRALAVPELAGHIQLLAGQPDSSGLRTLFTTWITLPPAALAGLLPCVVDGCVRYLSAEGAGGRFAAAARTTVELADGYPGDAGVLASLLLNRITLEPGQGLFLAAGNLHAYLRGLAVEIMANSDNVLRGGLTPKHVDVPELLRVLDFEPILDPVIEPRRCGPDAVYYPTPTREFTLRRYDLAAAAEPSPVTVAGPNIVLCSRGRVALGCAGVTLTVCAGGAAWVSAADAAVTAQALDADAQLFTASVGVVL
jgi:mannose-6-phosphate isomerase